VPLREALKVLEGEGQVVYAAHRGYVVAELSVGDLVEVYRLRELLEAEAVRRAVEQLTDDDVAALRAGASEVDAADATGDVVLITAANRRFHFLLFDLAGMPRLTRTLRQLWDATDVYRSVYFAERANRDRIHDEHLALVDALARRDAEAAVAAQDAHRAHSVAAVTAALEARG
jgi:DNA-binding GntR family transcriptional regulator